MSVREHVDVVVVGAGSTGSAAAAFLAEQGRSVMVVDRRGRARAGARWVNGVPLWCFDRAGIARPVEPERFSGGHDFLVGVHESDVRIRVRGVEGVDLDMRALTARLAGRAERAGARFLEGTVTAVTLATGRVTELSIETPSGRLGLAPRLVVDASGLSGAVRRRVPGFAELCPTPTEEDLCAAAQHQYRIADETAFRAFLRDHDATPGDSVGWLGVAGGYSTLTLFTEPTCREVGVLTGSIRALGHPSGAQILRRFVEAQPWIGEHLYGGQGAIPIRRPFVRLAGFGVALVGDAGCQVYAAHGSGVGMGLVASRILSDSVSRSQDPGHPRALRRYERRFHRRHGGVLAGSDAFRRFSQALERDDIEALLRSGLLDAELFAMGLSQKPARVRPAWLLAQIGRAVREPARARQVAPAVLRVLALQTLLRRVAPPRSLPAARLFDRLLSHLTGGQDRPPQVREIVAPPGEHVQSAQAAR
ncbi:MAG: FAD-dependent oxidoreductase [Deltaproteobacteria bacterium]|nr:FAD-dependent oxidoreductase [Deltaproteobacteria bacterium]